MQNEFEEFKNDRVSEAQKNEAEEQIIEKQKISDYDIREYPIEVLVQKFTEGLEKDEADIFIPDYQREMIWKKPQKVRFIESILINLPIPYLFLADTEDGRSEVVDGSQRIRTIVEFVQNQFKLENLELLPLLEGFYFEDLPVVRKRRFYKKTIRLIEMTQNMDEEARRQMFDRLNTGGTNLRPMEQRRGSSDGKFLTFIKRLAKNELFHKVCPISKSKLKHREDEEFVLRFFAYLDRYKTFDHRVDEFLDAYLDEMNNYPFDEQKLEQQFIKMLTFVDNNFTYGFRKSANNNSVPRIRFESMSVGIALALEEQPNLEVKNVDWLFSKEFGHFTRSDASNSRTKVINRIHFVRDNLLEQEIEYEGDPSSMFDDPRKIDKQPELF
ncbi:MULTISPECIES: DUF262 domain-containing protein [Vibrio]|uniref:DUF262 domain-containing protein n=1 Tax=Vibrio TaxID=662 RepID=UPI0005ABE9D8|nr:MULTISPECIES: DUF262 domain-containing protein [Vibrio]MDW1794105.1 DUF262 domain-containing protein [Vibrio sp. Vb2297]